MCVGETFFQWNPYPFTPMFSMFMFKYSHGDHFGKCEAHRKSICFCDCGSVQSVLRMLNVFCIVVCASAMVFWHFWWEGMKYHGETLKQYM